MGKGKRIAIYTDSKSARGPPIKYGDQILRLLKAVHLLIEVSVSHSKGSTEVVRGKQAANQAVKRAALWNNDFIGIVTLVPQTNLPETSSYTEGETLSEGFQDDHMGWFCRRDSFFCLGTSNGSWLTLYMPSLI